MPARYDLRLHAQPWRGFARGRRPGDHVTLRCGCQLRVLARGTICNTAFCTRHYRATLEGGPGRVLWWADPINYPAPLGLIIEDLEEAEDAP